MKLRLAETKFRILCQKYPALEEIDSFSPGLKAVMFQIVTCLNKSKVTASDAEIEDMYRRKVSENLNKVINDND